LSCVVGGVILADRPPTTQPGTFITNAPAPERRTPAPLQPQRTPGPSARTLAPAGTPDDAKEILIVQALEQPTSLRIEDAPIGEAIRALSEKTGVPIEFDRFILGCLPYGSRTMVTARIENRPLKESLTALLRPLAAKYVLENDKLVIQPRPPLFRIGRRATWDEVALIEKLYSTPWSKELADSLQFQFQDMSTEDSQASRKKIYDLAGSVGAAVHAARVLELACKQHGWEWHTEGNAVAICTNVRQVERQLQRNISAQYNEIPLEEVLLDLVWRRAGLELKMEPGVLSSLPTHQAERFLMTVENVTVRQALELVVGKTGLGYFIEPDGMRITAAAFAMTTLSAGGVGDSDAAAQAAAQAAASRLNPIVGQVTFPGDNGATFSFFLREQDLPPDVNQLRERHLRLFGDKMRDALSSIP